MHHSGMCHAFFHNVQKRVVWTVVLLALATAAGWVYYGRNRSGTEPTITTVPVTRGDIVETVDATGTLEAVTTVQVGTQVSGTIKALHADFNTRVRRGQVVAELDPSLFETQVAQARASVARLEADAQRAVVQLEDLQQKLRRARELAGQGLIPATDLEAAEMNARAAEATVKAANAQVVQARASLNQNEVNLAHTVITAPIDGIVISRNVDVGQTVAASMQAPTLFVIANDLREMQVNASIAESDIGRIQAGQPVSFRVDAYPDHTFTGTVSQVRLQPIVEQNVVSYATVIDVPNPDLRLKPGMTATVTVEIARADDVLQVPNAALRVRPSADVVAAMGTPRAAPSEVPTSGRLAGEAPAAADSSPHTGRHGANGQVWVLAGGRLARVPVRTGITDGIRTAVLADGLLEGADVVTAVTGNVQVAPAPNTSPLLPTFRGRGAGRGGAAGNPLPPGR